VTREVVSVFVRFRAPLQIASKITAQVNKLKEYERLLSAYNDVMGEMPLKSGLKEKKTGTRSRQLRRDINRRKRTGY
jgi:hypothetical protein